uniref:N-terminal EF-hand calcium binding protein 3 n=1 Tax=Periophthalmus magnuspinnatus TaxID=409849 RepID=A0A3B3ZV44_9GOBI
MYRKVWIICCKRLPAPSPRCSFLLSFGRSLFYDGKLSMEEFHSYFTDGILTKEQMQELYYSIDRHVQFSYFSPHLGEYVNVLSALEKLNVAILKAMDKTKEDYQGSSVLGQFVTRFLLRETSTQLQSLQSSLDCAVDAVLDQSGSGRGVVRKPEDLPILKNNKRPGRRIQKNMCLSPTDPYSGMLTTGVSVEPENPWGSQVDRLEQLVDKLDCENVHLTQQKRKMCFFVLCSPSSVSLQNLPDRSCFIMYEFWQDRLSWMSFLQSPISKTFQRCVINSLEEPEMVSTMLLPASWWIMNNNN